MNWEYAVLAEERHTNGVTTRVWAEGAPSTQQVRGPDDAAVRPPEYDAAFDDQGRSEPLG
jgi:hypothetical protein